MNGILMFVVQCYRRDAQKVVYLQHGILDSSMGWVILLASCGSLSLMQNMCPALPYTSVNHPT